jgi:hypothetical protein
LYTPSRPTIPAIFTIGNESSGRIVFYINGSNQLAYGIFSVGDVNLGGSVPLQSWVHIAFVRSSTTVTAYINGVATGTTGTLSGTVGQSSAFYIGSSASGNNPLTGYISDLRVVNSAVYTTGFTPPTSPVTAISGTQLLCNFTNAGIFDNTGKNNLETVGNAQIDTTTKKYGTGSMEFDGTGDYLFEPHNINYEFGNGDFTIEFWAYVNSLSGAYTGIVGQWLAGNTNAQNSWAVLINAFNATNKFGFSYSNGSVTTDVVFNSTTTTGSWDHYAIVRSGNTLYGFKNGSSLGFSSGSSSITATINNGTSNFYIATIGTASSGTDFNGYIDDLRITKGVARYTANFTAPTKAFPDQ